MTLRLREAWEDSIRSTAVQYFERFVSAQEAQSFKTKQQHAQDTGISSKFIERPLIFFEKLNLLQLEKKGKLYRITFDLPVACNPPANVSLPIWATEPRKSKSISSSVKKRIYELDKGVCAYCGSRVAFNKSKLDHIYPDARGGADAEENLTISCDSCNRKKWSYIPEEDNYLYPKSYRGKKVISISFSKIGKYYHPKFVLAE